MRGDFSINTQDSIGDIELNPTKQQAAIAAGSKLYFYDYSSGELQGEFDCGSTILHVRYAPDGE